MSEGYTDLEPNPFGPARFVQHDEIEQGQYTGGRTSAISTGGLAICIRVAVVGWYPNTSDYGYDRFLAHVDDGEEPLLTGFVDLVKEAKRHGLRNLRALLIFPDPESGGSNDDGTNDDEIRQQQVWNLVHSIVEDPARIHVHSHDSETAWILNIEADKRLGHGPDVTGSHMVYV